MDFTEVIKKRRSIRQFKEDTVPEEKLVAMIELAKLAPSAGNLQSYKVAILRGENLTNISAPINLVICADIDKSGVKYGERGKTLYAIQDATVFASYLQLVAVELGLSTVWIGAFNEHKVREKLTLSNNLMPVAIILLGYPSIDKVGVGNRRSYEEIVL